ncbi:MAG: hypothetical protein Q8O49_00190 [bacterium]|nr:hypothetical protein [bacterium]
MNSSFFNFRRGQMSLPVILIICGVFIEIAIAGAFIVGFMISSGQGERLSVRALAAAEAGLRDAFIKVARDKSFLPSPNPYVLSVDDDSVSIFVERTPLDSNFTSYQVTVTGIAGTRQRKLISSLLVDNNTGETKLQSIEETTII